MKFFLMLAVRIKRKLDMLFKKNKSILFDPSYDTNLQRNYRKLKETIGNGKPIIGRYPLNVQIQTISACNGKCKFCPYQGSWNDLHPGKMTLKTYKKIIQNLKSYKIRKFCPYLENEPLLDADLFEKIRYAVENLNPEWIELSTNLSMLNEEKLEAIKEIFPKIPHEIWISFHGISKESYEDIMGLSFEKSLNNVLQLIELSQIASLRIVIRGAGAPELEKTNLKSWFGENEYLAFWEKHLSRFKNKPRISFFTYHDRAGSQQLKSKGINFNIIVRENLRGFYCVRFDRWLHFLYTGEPVLCCMDYNKETTFGGSIKNRTIEELYSSPEFIELIKKGIGMIDSKEDFICKKCIHPGT